MKRVGGEGVGGERAGEEKRDGEKIKEGEGGH